MALYQSVADTIGNTPLVRIKNFEKANDLEANVYAKLEYFNPAGSVKDRIAKAIIDDAVATGKLKEGATIIEPTSGNTGIGISSYAAAKGFKVIITMPESMSVERRNLMKAYGENAKTPVFRAKRVAVVGGGNVAMDAARTALRLGAENVYIVYRRGMEELPARREEVEHAMEEGVDFRLLCNPTEILGYHNPDDRRDIKNGTVIGMKCIKMELGEPDASGRRRPVPVEGAEFVLDVDCVIIAVGTSPNPLIRSTTSGLETTKRGGLVVTEETGETTRENVYAGGDAVTGAATVILAMGAGKTAAKAIDEKLSAGK